MRLILTFILSISLFTNANSQSIELGGGYNHTNFYDTESQEGSYYSDYTGEGRYSIFIRYEDTVMNGLLNRFILSFDSYSGKINASDVSPGGSNSVSAEVNKMTLGLDFLPIHIKIAKAGSLDFGVALNFLVDEKNIGEKVMSSITTPPFSVPLDNNFSNFFTFGIMSRAAYKIKLADKWYVIPEYMFNLGLTHEFQNYATKSYRHLFAVGIMKDL